MALVTPRIAIIAFALLTSGAAAAQQVATDMTCASVQAHVARSGPQVLHFTRFTYDRVGANPAFCGRRNSAPVWIATRDNAQCLAGYVCTQYDNR